LVFMTCIITIFRVVFDLFRSADVTGLAKAGWLLVIPLIGVPTSPIVRSHGAADRSITTQLEDADRLRAAAGLAPTEQTSQAKLLRDQGARTQGVRGDLTEDPL
jgi:hypothetical protein